VRIGYLRGIAMKTSTAILSGCLLLALVGCGGSSNPGVPPDIQPVGLLSPVSDPAAFEASLKNGLTARAAPEVLALAGTAQDSSFTGTYTQEANVDEADPVRYDGEHLYVAPRRFFRCCFILNNAVAAPDIEPPEGAIRILATDPVNGEANLVSEIPLDDGVSVQGMYVENDTMFALTAQSFYGHFGQLWADIAIWAPEKFGFKTYDVSDAADPKLTFEASIDGVFVESRRIGNTVYIVSRHTPWIAGLNYYVSTAEEQADNDALLTATPLEDLLPKITIAGDTRPLVEPRNCYVTTADDDTTAENIASHPVLTSITAVPIDNPANFSTTCYKESAYGVYVSESALYLAEHRPDTSLRRDITRIHKFALGGTRVRYRGSADIEGTVWRGGQADFRMSENNGNLRVLASQFDWTNEDFVDHELTILREASTAAKLDLAIVSTLPNSNRPEEIGKPNEALFGVRFTADRAYAVTFERIDPLYVIDLSQPADPFIAGELEVPGVSDFLHPVSDELLVGLGREMPGGVKLELFDVSNISLPLSRGTAVIGGPGSYSEAIYNRHAFTYQADVAGIDRFTLPANVYASDGSYQFLGSALYLFEIRNKMTPELASLNLVGSVDPPEIGTQAEWIERSRAFIHDDTIYYIRNEDVWGSFWYQPTIVNGPF
jgi:uncharacterized secreted protein with C-terminal beta-propeller domain